MKRMLLMYCLAFFVNRVFCQPLQVADVIPADIVLTSLNDNREIRLGDLRGSILLIEFWATWCGPCIGALEKFEKLQKQFPGKLAVLAVSGEGPERLRRFINSKKPGVRIISDTSGMMQRLFPHRIIPHTVLADKAGKVIAITEAGNITDTLLRQLMAGQHVKMAVKQDKTDFDPTEYFRADTALKQAFIMQPAVDGVGTFLKLYPNTNFAQRRMTVVNGTRSLLYRFVFDKSYFRTINLYDTINDYKKVEKFCIDAWVEEKSEAQLKNFLQQQFARNFIDVDAKIEKRIMKVFVIKATDSALLKLKKGTISTGEYDAGGGFFNGKGVGVDKLARYLEDFGIMNKPVIDKTGLTGQYAISFDWQPEEKPTLFEALKKLGLYLEEKEEEIEVLVIRRV